LSETKKKKKKKKGPIKRKTPPPDKMPIDFIVHPVDPSIPLEERDIMQMLPSERGPGGWNLYKPEYCKHLMIHMSQGYSFSSFAGRILVSEGCIDHWAINKPEFRQAKQIGKALQRMFYENKGMQNLGNKEFNGQIWRFLTQLNITEARFESKVNVEATIKSDVSKVKEMSTEDLIKLGKEAIKYIEAESVGKSDKLLTSGTVVDVTPRET